MLLFQKNSVTIPGDVPQSAHAAYIKNYRAITKNTNRLVLFAGDQKIEHLNKDFYGPGIAPEDNSPEHLFKIANLGTIGAFATNVGLISRYGTHYPKINYVAKLNAKTDLIPKADRDPVSKNLWTVQDVLTIKQDTKLNIRGIGCALYPGSSYEHEMLTQAAQNIFQAHQHGLIALVWIYPRGNAVPNEHDGELLAGAAGLANALGADFVKINPPEASDGKTSAEWLRIAAQAAGNTHILCSGGKATAPEAFFKELYEQIQIGKIAGSATGRNIHQRPLREAIAFTRALSALVYDDKNVAQALEIFKK